MKKRKIILCIAAILYLSVSPSSTVLFFINSYIGIFQPFSKHFLFFVSCYSTSLSLKGEKKHLPRFLMKLASEQISREWGRHISLNELRQSCSEVWWKQTVDPAWMPWFFNSFIWFRKTNQQRMKPLYWLGRRIVSIT